MTLTTTVVRALGIVAVALLLAAPGTVRAQDRTVAVRFPAGASGTVLKGTVAGRDSVLYTLGAEAGQTLRVRLTSKSTSISFNIYAPGKNPGDEALAIGDMLPETNRYEGVLPASGDYTISVFLNRAAGRRNAKASYSLDLSIPASGRAGAGPVKGDFADGLQGGPDAWTVAGVAAGDVLHVRKGPSTRDQSLASLANGALLQNGGCRMVGAQRWCQVTTTQPPGVRGWAAGRYLREAAAPAAAAGLPAACKRLAAVDFATSPARIRVVGEPRPGPEGSLVDATVDLGAQGIKPFACRFDSAGVYLGLFSKVDEGRL